MIEIGKIKANPVRGLIGTVSYGIVFIGATSQWGLPIGVLLFGLLLFIDVTVDEALERCTRLKRAKE